jgi:hypothetical protein
MGPGLNTIKHMDFTKPRSTYFPNDHVRNAWRIQLIQPPWVLYDSCGECSTKPSSIFLKKATRMTKSTFENWKRSYKTLPTIQNHLLFMGSFHAFS